MILIACCLWMVLCWTGFVCISLHHSGYLVCWLHHGRDDQWEDALQRKRLYPLTALSASQGLIMTSNLPWITLPECKTTFHACLLVIWLVFTFSLNITYESKMPCLIFTHRMWNKLWKMSLLCAFTISHNISALASFLHTFKYTHGHIAYPEWKAFFSCNLDMQLKLVSESSFTFDFLSIVRVWHLKRRLTALGLDLFKPQFQTLFMLLSIMINCISTYKGLQVRSFVLNWQQFCFVCLCPM